jgi:hypothetical protein
VARRTLQEMREAVARMVSNSPNILATDIDGLLNDVHRTFASSYQWSYRKRQAMIQTVSAITAGTVTATQNSPVVQGVGTAWTAALVGRQIRIAGENVFWWIAAVDVPLQRLTLADWSFIRAWVAPSVSGAAYTIFQDTYPVPQEVAVILSATREWPLAEASSGEIDMVDPYRTSPGVPDRWYWSEVFAGGDTRQEIRYVGLWPVPMQAMSLRMPYLIEPPDLKTPTDQPVCPSEVLEWAAGARAAQFLHGKTGDAKWRAMAGDYNLVLMGTNRGTMGVLEQALHDDSHRFGLPTGLQGSGLTVGYDRLSQRDWAAMF